MEWHVAQERFPEQRPGTDKEDAPPFPLSFEEDVLTFPADAAIRDVPKLVMSNLALLDRQIKLLAANTQWSMDHVHEGLLDLKTGLCNSGVIRSPMGSELAMSPSAAPSVVFTDKQPDPLESVRQLSERLENVVSSACKSLEETSGNHDQVTGAVQGIASTLMTLEELLRQRLPASGEDAGHDGQAGLPKLSAEPQAAGYQSQQPAAVTPASQDDQVPRSKFNSNRCSAAAVGRALMEQHGGPKLSVEEMAAQLVRWMRTSSEKFQKRVFARELATQILFYTAGFLAIPLIYPFYGNPVALANRAFIPNGSIPFYMLQVIPSFCALSSIIIFLTHGRNNDDLDYIEIGAILSCILFRCVIIAQKYAYMPLSVYNMYNKVPVSTEYVKETLLITGWGAMPDELRDKVTADALLTVFGPGNSGGKLRFVPTPRTAGELLLPSRLQGRMTRQMAAGVLLNGDLNQFDAVPSYLDLNIDLKSKGEDAGKLRPDETGDVPLSDFFAFLVRAVLEKETKGFFRTVARLVPVASLISALLPQFARWWEYGTVFGRTWSTMAIACLNIPIIFIHWGAFLAFLHIGCLDLWRRRTLVNCLCAVLSDRWEDRKQVPQVVRQVGVLDLRHIESAESFRDLRELCYVWGKPFSQRCLNVVETSVVFAAIFVGMFLFFTENGLYGFITQFLVFIVVIQSSFQALAILITAFLGQQINGATGRCVYLLHHHMTALSLSKYQDGWGEDPNFDGSIECIEVVSGNMEIEQETNPVNLLGVRMGFGLLSTLNLVVGLVVQRFITYCQAEPHMCFLE